MRWPFSRKNSKPSESSIRKISRDKKMGRVEIVGGSFFSFDSTESPNGEYVVACSDFCAETRRGGNRESGNGGFILAHQEQVLLEQYTLQRPTKSAVADNGDFVINDWLFNSDLRGVFYAFDKTGKTLIRQQFEANLYNNAISVDGAYAVSGCANNSHQEDGACVALFDLVQGKCLWKQALPTGPFVEHYQLDTAKQILTVTYKEGASYRYAFSGQFLDQEQWDAERMQNGSIYVLIAEYKQQFKALKPVTSATTQTLIAQIQTLLDVNKHPYLPDKAKAYRLLGEIHEALDQKIEALQYYKQALALDDKVGVKSKIKKLSQ